MSPSLSPSSSPQQSPAPALVPVPKRRSRARTWLVLIPLGLIGLAAGAWKAVERSQNSAAQAVVSSVRTARVVRGALARTLRLTGSISAKKYASISAPVLQGPEANRELVLIQLGEPGSYVKKDQIVGIIDGQSIADHVDDLDNQISQMQLESRSLAAHQLVQLESILQRARGAKAAYQQAVVSSRAAAVRNSFDQELIKLNVEQAQLEFQEAENQIALLHEKHQIERYQQQLNIDKQVSHRGRHLVDLQRFIMRSPIDGQLILKTVSRNGQIAQVQVGDQINPGQSVLRIVDLSDMAIEASISQSDSEIVRKGQKAKVHFDAYPDLVLDAHVEAVGMLASANRRGSFYVRRIPVRIAIDGRDPRVIPDLTASADVVIEEDDDSLVIPRDALTESNGKPVVFVKQGETLTAREVGIGSVSNTRATVVSGLQEGEEIAVEGYPR
jgi:HlyD family secretion protein